MLIIYFEVLFRKFWVFPTTFGVRTYCFLVLTVFLESLMSHKWAQPNLPYKFCFHQLSRLPNSVKSANISKFFKHFLLKLPMTPEWIISELRKPKLSLNKYVYSMRKITKSVWKFWLRAVCIIIRCFFYL